MVWPAPISSTIAPTVTRMERIVGLPPMRSGSCVILSKSVMAPLSAFLCLNATRRSLPAIRRPFPHELMHKIARPLPYDRLAAEAFPCFVFHALFVQPRDELFLDLRVVERHCLGVFDLPQNLLDGLVVRAGPADHFPSIPRLELVRNAGLVEGVLEVLLRRCIAIAPARGDVFAVVARKSRRPYAQGRGVIRRQPRLAVEVRVHHRGDGDDGDKGEEGDSVPPGGDGPLPVER